MQNITTSTLSKHGTHGWICYIKINDEQSIIVTHPDKNTTAQRASTIAGMLRDVLATNDHLEF